MSIYKLRRNFFINREFNGTHIEAKVAFKTEELEWLQTEDPVIVPVSIQSAFHRGIEGRIKMEALLGTLADNIRAPVVLLMAGSAHQYTLQLTEADALGIITREQNRLRKEFAELFASFQILEWSAFIRAHPRYDFHRKNFLIQCESDSRFHELLEQDASHLYRTRGIYEGVEQESYIQAVYLDLLEQCICIRILAEEGYRFQFYPGRQYASVTYASQDNNLALIHVFLSVEKKKISPGEYRSP